MESLYNATVRKKIQPTLANHEIDATNPQNPDNSSSSYNATVREKNQPTLAIHELDATKPQNADNSYSSLNTSVEEKNPPPLAYDDKIQRSKDPIDTKQDVNVVNKGPIDAVEQNSQEINESLEGNKTDVDVSLLPTDKIGTQNSVALNKSVLKLETEKAKSLNLKDSPLNNKTPPTIKKMPSLAKGPPKKGLNPTEKKLKRLQDEYEKKSNYFGYYQQYFHKVVKNEEGVRTLNKVKLSQWHSKAQKLFPSESLVCLMKKDDKFCLTCKCQPNCKSIKLVSEFSTKLRNSLLLRNLEIISEEYSKNESNKREFKDDVVTCFEDLDNICKHLSQAFSNFSKGASIGFKNGSNYKWDKLRDGIVDTLAEASAMLISTRVADFFKAFDMEEVLKSLNADLKNFDKNQEMIVMDYTSLFGK